MVWGEAVPAGVAARPASARAGRRSGLRASSPHARHRHGRMPASRAGDAAPRARPFGARSTAARHGMPSRDCPSPQSCCGPPPGGRNARAARCLSKAPSGRARKTVRPRPWVWRRSRRGRGAWSSGRSGRDRAQRLCLAPTWGGSSGCRVPQAGEGRARGRGASQPARRAALSRERRRMSSIQGLSS